MMQEISAKKFLDALQNPTADFVVLDVRTPWEWQEKKLSDPRMLFVEMQEILVALEKISTEKQIFVLCRSGNRSAMVAQFLEQNGRNAWNVQGGMLEIGFLQSFSS